MGEELGHTMNILDLGGGFPGLEGAKVRFEEVMCGQVWPDGYSVVGYNNPTVHYLWPDCQHLGLGGFY